MGYAIMQIKDQNGDYIDWDGALVPGPDGTLGSVVVKRVLEEAVERAEGIDVAVAGAATVVVATHSVPVSEVHKVFGYGLSANDSGVDWFGIRVDGVLKAKVYTRTYQGGQLDDHLVLDNDGGSVPIVVELVAHNSSVITPHQASGFVLLENITASQAP